MPDRYVPHVIVKFRTSLLDPQVGDAADKFRTDLIAGAIAGSNWPQLVRQREFQGITIEKLLTAISQARLVDLVNLAFERDPSYRLYAPNLLTLLTLLTYFAVPCPPNVNPEAVAHALSAWDTVENAYVAAAPAPPPGVTRAGNPAWMQDNTAFLRQAPGGINAEYAWDLQGGHGGGDGGGNDGVTLQFFQIESDSDETHPDLAPANPQFLYGKRNATSNRTTHGTATLGIVIASDGNPNNLPLDPYYRSSIGITPHVAVTLLASYWVNNYNTDHYNTILFAIDNLQRGDVLLLEAQLFDPSNTGYVPVEYDQHNFDAIRLGTALGIVIVEPAGNAGISGGYDLSTLGKSWLQRPSNKDSGAIIVSAATPWMNGGTTATNPPTPPDYIHVPIMTGSLQRAHNYGDRIDCYAWGDSIYTTQVGGYGLIGDTSGASAIIAGAALSLQGMAEKQLGYRLSSLQIRKILSDPVTGTIAGSRTAPPNSPVPTDWNKHQIGVMPDLKAISIHTLGIVPDVYIRDFLGDIGNLHTGPVSSSPDIILRSTPVADPQADFGENSLNRDNVLLSENAVPGNDHYIYVRVLNRGIAATTNVTATVYWSDPATLVTPDRWNLIGSTIIPNVPPSNFLTVSPSIKWSTIPGTGHYCFVATIGGTEDPAPMTPAQFLATPATTAWDNYVRFIRDNNNVTWRNFDIIPIPVSGPSKPTGFHIAGPWSQDARMSLEVVSRLPSESRIMLHVPAKDWLVLSALREFGPVEPIDMEEQQEGFAIQLNPHGRSKTTEFEFPKKFWSKCWLLIDIPEQFRKYPYEISMRQIAQHQEVGRITWRLVSQPDGDEP